MKIARELNALPPLAVRWTKLSVNKWIKQQLNLILDASIAYEMLSINSRDHHEAAKAFLEKRPPSSRACEDRHGRERAAAGLERDHRRRVPPRRGRVLRGARAARTCAT